jgi:hypothetical protein
VIISILSKHYEEVHLELKTADKARVQPSYLALFYIDGVQWRRSVVTLDAYLVQRSSNFMRRHCDPARRARTYVTAFLKKRWKKVSDYFKVCRRKCRERMERLSVRTSSAFGGGGSGGTGPSRLQQGGAVRRRTRQSMMPGRASVMPTGGANGTVTMLNPMGVIREDSLSAAEFAEAMASESYSPPGTSFGSVVATATAANRFRRQREGASSTAGAGGAAAGVGAGANLTAEQLKAARLGSVAKVAAMLDMSVDEAMQRCAIAPFYQRCQPREICFAGQKRRQSGPDPCKRIGSSWPRGLAKRVGIKLIGLCVRIDSQESLTQHLWVH